MADEVHIETRQQWREWLTDHHTEREVLVVTWRTPTGRPAPSYDDLVEEALCVGWIDSAAKRLDEERTSLRFSPRKPGSGWAATNKERITRLTEAGLMQRAGTAVVEAAKADGSWTLLDDVEAGVVPDDLAAALDARPPARANFDGFPRSARRSLLLWVSQAKRPATRERRVREIAEKAQVGERAHE